MCVICKCCIFGCKQPNNLHHTLHPDITKLLIDSFKITHSYYSYPLTCPIQLTHYNSPHNRDILFGSMGHVKFSRWKGIGLAFPMDHNTTLEAIHWARMAAKEDVHTITILIVNHKNWTTQLLPLNTNVDIHTIATIPLHTIHYVPTPEWPRYYQYIEPSLTSIICIDNQAHLSMNLQTPHELQKVLKKTLKTHIDTYPINPTPTQYNVEFSNSWKTAPKQPPTSSLQTTIQHPYRPNTITSIHSSFIHKNAYTQMDHLSHPPQTLKVK